MTVSLPIGRCSQLAVKAVLLQSIIRNLFGPLLLDSYLSLLVSLAAHESYFTPLPQNMDQKVAQSYHKIHHGRSMFWKQL